MERQEPVGFGIAVCQAAATGLRIRQKLSYAAPICTAPYSPPLWHRIKGLKIQTFRGSNGAA